MDGNLSLAKMLDSGDLPAHSFTSLWIGCMRDIHVSHPSGGEVVQIGCPVDLSGNPRRNDEPKSSLGFKMRVAGSAPTLREIMYEMWYNGLR